MAADIKKILGNNKYLDSKYTNVRLRHQENTDFCMPRKASMNSFKQTGDRTNFGFLYDSVAIRSLKIAVAGFYSYFTNPASVWYGLQASDPRDRKDKAAQTYFKECEEIMNPILSNSNFYPASKEFYFDAIGIGTATIFSEEDKIKKARFRCLPIGEMNFEEDEYGEISASYWNFKLNPDQAFSIWGKNSGKTVIERVTQGGTKAKEDMEFLLYIGPREDREYGKVDKLNMPYASCWINKIDNHLMDEGGYEENPMHTGRFWKDNESPFGYCPADDALAEIKLRNAQKKTALRRAMKETDPPLDIPSKGYLMPLNLNPAAINYRDPKLGENNRAVPFGVGAGDFNITKEMMEQSKAEIEEHFFVPLFRAFSQITKTMTIPEVQERIREGMVLLGPAVGNLEPPFKSLIIRLHSMLHRQGELPDPPESLQGKEFTPVFLSPLSRAQREGEITSIKNFLADVAGIASVYPEAVDKVNPDRTIEIIANIRGINPDIMQDQKTIDATRDQRAKVAQAQQQMDAAHKGVAIAKTGAEAEAIAKGA